MGVVAAFKESDYLGPVNDEILNDDNMEAQAVVSMEFGIEFVTVLLTGFMRCCWRHHTILVKPPGSHVCSHRASHGLLPLRLIKSLIHTGSRWEERAWPTLSTSAVHPKVQIQDTQINSKSAIKESPCVSGEHSKKEDRDFTNSMG